MSVKHEHEPDPRLEEGADFNYDSKPKMFGAIEVRVEAEADNQVQPALLVPRPDAGTLPPP